MDGKFRIHGLMILGMVVSMVGLILAWPTTAYAGSPPSYWQVADTTPPLFNDIYNSSTHFAGDFDDIAINRSLLSNIEFSATPPLAPSAVGSCASAVRIMPLGDSITRGSLAFPPVGYRKPLYLALEGAGYNVDFVGVENNGDGTFDQDHQGVSGNRADQTRDDIYGGGQDWLLTHPADVILLHTGTNDIIENQTITSTVTEVGQILDKIDNFENDEGIEVTVILAKIINQDVVTNTATVTAYNNALQVMADDRITNGDNIIVVDMESALIYPDDLDDEYHPLPAGYDKMAAVWFTALTGILPVCDGFPSITSSAITTAINGQPYTYDVEADGDPTITFTAPVSPSGMAINSSSGLITWTPGGTGDFPVTVNAINGVGTATQTFSINVTDPVAPSIVSSPKTDATVDVFYAYQVEADGTPPLTFSLAGSPPAGMSINGSSGLVEWTPTMTGSYNVTVEATNSVDTASQPFTIDVTDGLVCPADVTAFWPLDETGGSTYDDFYDGHDATCTGTGGVCPMATASGRINGAQVFNGNNTRLNVPADADFDWAADGSFSIELWVKGNGQTCNTTQVLIGRDDTSTDLQWWLGCNSGGATAFQLHDKSGGGPTLNGPDIDDGAWHHLVAVRNGATNGAANYLYVDGTEAASTTHTYTDTFASTAPLNIGWFNNPPAGTFQFNGTIDEVATYNRALSPAEIQSHYTNGQTGVGYCGLIELAPEITSDPVTTGTVNELYIYNVDASGTPPVTYSLPVSPSGMSIDPGTGVIQWTPTMTGSYNVTVQATNSAGSDTQPFTINVAGPEAPTILSTEITEAVINQLYTYDVVVSGTLPIAFSLPVSPSGMSIDPGTGVIQWTPTMTGSYNVTVQATNSVGFDTQPFTINVIDEFICPANIKAYWDLDETGGSTYDESYSGNDATCTGTCPTATTSGQVNGAQVFNGSNTRLNVPASADFNWTKDSNFSIELWMKGTSGQTCNTTQVLVGRDDSSSGLQWWLGCNSDGTAGFQLHDKSGNGPTLGGPSINDGWHHLVAVRDGAIDTDYLYVDGVEVDSTVFDHTDDFDSTGQAINFGWFDNRSGPGFQFNGTIDEIVTYDKALTETEIEHRFNRGLDKLALCELPQITIAKTPAFQSVAYNTTANFSVAVTNTNAITITDVDVTDGEAPNCSTAIASIGPGQKVTYACTKSNVVTEFINNASVQAKTFFGDTSMSKLTPSGATVDIPSSMSIKKSATPTVLTAPGGTVTYTIRITNTSAVDAITIDNLVDDKDGSLNGKGTCSVSQSITVNNVYQCTYTDSVTGSSGYVETGKVTASGHDDDNHAISGNASTTVSIDPGEASDFNVYLPVIIRN